MNTHHDKLRRTGPARRFDSWRIIGMGGGGTMMDPTISPHEANVVLEMCDMTGAYVSLDGGQSYRMFNLRGRVFAFAFDPIAAKTIYAANSALWRSDDLAATWRMVWPDPTGAVEHMRGDEGEYLIESADPSYPSMDCRITAVAIDPADSNCIYLAASRRGSPIAGNRDRGPRQGGAELFRSTDHGASFRRIVQLPFRTAGGIYIQSAGGDNPGGRKTVFVFGPDAVLAGDDPEGWQTFPAPEGCTIQNSTAGAAAGQPLTFYVTTQTAWSGGRLTGGIYVSTDGCRTWRQSIDGILPPAVRGRVGGEQGEGSAGSEGSEGSAGSEGSRAAPRFRGIACCRTQPSVAYVGIDEARQGRRSGERLCGLAKTTDGGANWRWVLREPDRPAANMEISWIEPRAVDGAPNVEFDGAPYLGVAPADPDVCFAGDGFRTYRTGDGGESWRQLNSRQVGPDRWTTSGLDVTTCYGVHFDPFDPAHIFITYTDMGLFHSRDGGRSWTGATVGIPNRWRNTTYWIAHDPRIKGLLWGAFALHHDLPRTKMWRGRQRVDYEGGVAVSTDGGDHWTVCSDGLGQTAATHILMDPASPAGRRTLYVCGFGRGVFKSTDNGRNWAQKNNGLAGAEPFAWRLTRADDGTLYLVLARRSDGGAIGDDQDGALYRSTDGAESWQRLSLPTGVNGPMGLTLDPADPRRMYLAAWALSPGPTQPNRGGGIFLSQDGGGSWRCVLDGDQHVYDVTVDSRNGALYATGFEAAAWRSDDRGPTWRRIRGYNFRWGHRVIPDPADEAMIYIATFGGSVWHGPAAGDPAAPEDAASILPHEP